MLMRYNCITVNYYSSPKQSVQPIVADLLINIIENSYFPNNTWNLYCYKTTKVKRVQKLLVLSHDKSNTSKVAQYTIPEIRRIW